MAAMETPTIRIREAAARLRGVVERTPLVPFPGPLPGAPPIELRLKLECLQVTGAFKARGAWNQVSQLTDAERRAGPHDLGSCPIQRSRRRDEHRCINRPHPC